MPIPAHVRRRCDRSRPRYASSDDCVERDAADNRAKIRSVNPESNRPHHDAAVHVDVARRCAVAINVSIDVAVHIGVAIDGPRLDHACYEQRGS